MHPTAGCGNASTACSMRQLQQVETSRSKSIVQARQEGNEGCTSWNGRGLAGAIQHQDHTNVRAGTRQCSKNLQQRSYERKKETQRSACHILHPQLEEVGSLAALPRTGIVGCTCLECTSHLQHTAAVQQRERQLKSLHPTATF